jgi:hypothetical protein
MISQQIKQQPLSRHREDRKVEQLVKRIEAKIALQAKAIREANQASSKN